MLVGETNNEHIHQSLYNVQHNDKCEIIKQGCRSEMWETVKDREVLTEKAANADKKESSCLLK